MSPSAPPDSSSEPPSQPSCEPPSEQPPARRGGRGRAPRAFATRNRHERIQAATARAIAAKGYEACTVEDICIEADIPVGTFHEHFKSKQEAALSALEAGVDQVMMDIREIFKSAPSWPEAVWEGFGFYLEWGAREPAFARLAFIEMMTAGEAALDLLQSLMDAFAMFLEPGYALAPAGGPSRRLVDEAVGNAVFGLVHEHILREGPETLPSIRPELVRAILVPFLGAEATSAFIAERSAGG